MDLVVDGQNYCGVCGAKLVLITQLADDDSGVSSGAADEEAGMDHSWRSLIDFLGR